MHITHDLTTWSHEHNFYEMLQALGIQYQGPARGEILHMTLGFEK